jgi:double-stranded uracil-DNA glycosylase
MSSKLPDYLASGLRVVFCGTAAGKDSASLGHYYAGTGNLFWTYLYRAKITAEPLFPSTDGRVLEFGVGLTDLAKKVAASSDRGLRAHYDVDGFVAKIERYRPTWVAFHGKEAANEVSKALGHGGAVALGKQDWAVAKAQVFVLPSASGSNRDRSRLEGKVDRVEWFKELAELLPPPPSGPGG